MSLTTQTHLGKHIFQGPFTNNSQLAALSGVYLTTTLAHDQHHTILDVGESSDIFTMISNHDRTNQWQKNAVQGLYAWVLNCDEQKNIDIQEVVAYALVYRRYVIAKSCMRSRTS